MNLCRICLSCEGRLYSMSKYGLEPMFQALTGIPIDGDRKLSQLVCAECGLRLISYNKLRDRSIRSHNMLCDLLSKVKGNIEHIKWKPNVKTARLTFSGLQVVECEPITDRSSFPSSCVPLPKIVKEEYESQYSNAINDINSQTDINNQENSQNDIYHHNGFDIETFLDVDDNETSNLHQTMLLELKNGRTIHKQTIPMIRADQNQKNKTGIFTQKRMRTGKVMQQTNKIKNKSSLDSMYTKIVMTNEEFKAAVFQRQFSSNYKNSSFRCNECFKGFINERKYEMHRLIHSQESGRFICDICKARYPTKNRIRKHITANHSFKYKCNCCATISNASGLAIRHALQHLGKTYICKYCNREYINHTTYHNHLRESHNSKYICELCGFSFVSALGVHHHKRLKHRFVDPNMEMDGPYCSSCDIKFATKEAYDKHFKTSIKHLIRAYDIKRERAVKRLGVSVQPHLGQRAPNLSRLCEHCGRTFKNRFLLEDHILTHGTEKKYQCQLCARAFKTKASLYLHKIVHNENRILYQCHLCGKEINQKGNFKRHLFLHTGVRPFECESCGKAFKSKSEKKLHFDYVHLKKPWPKRERNRRVIKSKSGASATDVK